MKPINTRLYNIWKELKKIDGVPVEILDELQNISDDLTNIENPYLPDDLVESIERYAIPQSLYGKRVSVLQEFNLQYEPDNLPTLNVKYIVMNDDYKRP